VEKSIAKYTLIRINSQKFTQRAQSKRRTQRKRRVHEGTKITKGGEVVFVRYLIVKLTRSLRTKTPDSSLCSLFLCVKILGINALNQLFFNRNSYQISQIFRAKFIVNFVNNHFYGINGKFPRYGYFGAG
jgi:hypothetical protein